VVHAARDRFAQYRERRGSVLRRTKDTASGQLHGAVAQTFHRAMAERVLFVDPSFDKPVVSERVVRNHEQSGRGMSPQWTSNRHRPPATAAHSVSTTVAEGSTSVRNKRSNVAA